jgi:hypothetical protein
MSLVPYSAMLFFPGGDPAVGALIDISLDGSNQPPFMYLDAAGTLPAPNPMTADATGSIMFYAAPSLYLAELAGTFTRIAVDPLYPNPVWPNLYVHTQAVASSVWTVDHYFGTSPDVTILGLTAQVETDVNHTSPLQTVITFSSPQTGTANLRK